MANAPDLSLRGAKRRGNLAVLCWISRKLRRKRNCFPEIAPQGHFLALRAQGATAPSGPRNDKSGSIAPLNSCHQYCQPAWRSLSAATDAIGRCVFIDTLHELEVPSRDCHVALLLAMTHQVVRRCTSALLPLNGSVQGGHYPQGARRIRKAAKPPTAAQGTPLQTQLVRAVFTTAGPNRQYAARPGCPLPLQRTAGGQRMIHSSVFSIHSSFSTRSVRPRPPYSVGLSNILYSELDRRKPV